MALRCLLKPLLHLPPATEAQGSSRQLARQLAAPFRPQTALLMQGCRSHVSRPFSTASLAVRSALASDAVATTPTAPHILRGALEHGPSVALVDPSGVSHTYNSLLHAAEAMADILSGGSSNGAEMTAPMAAGSRIGIFSKPGAEFVASLWGTWLAGHVAVPLCTSHPAAEILYVLQNSEASLVMGPEETRELLQPIAEQLGVPFLVYPTVPAGLPSTENGEGVSERLQEKKLEGSEQGALFIYTSGTTGRPKGVVHSHAGLAAQADMLVTAWEYQPSDRFLHVLPLHPRVHVHGIMNALLAPLSAGATVAMMPKFSPVGMWARLRKSYPPDGPPSPEAITVFTGVPTHYVRLIEVFDSMSEEDQRASAKAAGKLRLMMSGSAACPEPVMTRWEEITGQRLLERYGMTEFAMGLSNPLHGERKLGYVGYSLKGVETKVVSSESEEPGSEEGETEGEGSGEGEGEGQIKGGELLVRSPGMFKEYWKRPEANADAFDKDGFFKTGDTVAQDAEGCFKILGRTSVDIIKSGGYKLSALEIEAILLENPRIGECAVMGVPDAAYGEAVAVVLTVPSGETAMEAREFKKWCMERMAHYKIPSKLRIIESMPRNAMGKVNKKELRKQLFE